MEQPDPAEERRQKARTDMLVDVHNAVQRAALTMEDPALIADTPIFAGATSTEKRARPVTELKAAAWLGVHADQQIRHTITKARSTGVEWTEIGKALGLHDPHSDRSPAEAAFEQAVGSGRSDRSPAEAAFEQAVGSGRSDRYVLYDCSTCGQGVKDNGPYNQHPEDRETGHAETCERLNAAVAAYRKRMGDDE